MTIDKAIMNEFVKVNRNLAIGIHESLDKIEFDYGRKLLAIEVSISRIEKLIETMEKDLREQYYSIGRRLDILELQIINKCKDKDNTSC